jgi:hypothetical protein
LALVWRILALGTLLLGGCFSDAHRLTAGLAGGCFDFDADRTGALPNTWSSDGGSWKVIDDGDHHALAQTATVDARVIAVAPALGDNVQWTVVVRPGSTHGSDCAIARNRGDARYALCISGGSAWSLEREEAGIKTTLDSGKHSYDTDHDHKLTLTVDGAHLTGELDGNPLADQSDAALTGGDVGVGTDDNASRFTSACARAR